jgi:hypothetical protein
MNAKMQLIVGFLVLLASVPAWSDETPHRSRQQFAQAMNKIKNGMSTTEVRAVLGPPDDIWDARQDRAHGNRGQKEIWRYGTSGHTSLATLGEVWIDHKDCAFVVFGCGTPPAEHVIAEKELRRLLHILDVVSPYSASYDYNPRTVIRAVNELQQVGRDQALSVIGEYLRVTSGVQWIRVPVGTKTIALVVSLDVPGRDGLFLVMRTLFEVPDNPGHMPPMLVGLQPQWPEEKKLLPRFPICLQGDIPFLLPDVCRHRGNSERPEAHFSYFKAHGKMRARQLMPTDAPMEALAAIIGSPGWKAFAESDLDRKWGEKKNASARLQCEVLNLLNSVYRLKPADADYGWCLTEGEARREQIMRDVSNLKIRWNPTEQQYTFLDGKTLPPRGGAE